MKKLLFILLALTLLLAGCGNQAPEETTVPTTEPTEPPGLYVENSAIEQQTQGAVRLYELTDNGYTWLSAVGEQIVLGFGGNESKLQLLTGERGVISTETVLPVDLRTAVCQPTHSGFVYYDQQTNEAVYLDTQLQETRRIQLPESVQGNPAFSPDGGEVFYCVDQQIRALDVEQQISRLIKSHTCKSQTLLGCYFDGKMLACSIENEEGIFSTVYISAETGQTLRNDYDLLQIDTYADRYYVVRVDGSVEQRLFGAWEETRGQQLNVWDGKTVSALALDGILCYKTDGENGLELDFYEINSGKKTASVTIPMVKEPVAFFADRYSGSIWILASTDNFQVLLQWNPKASSVTQEQAYTSPAYTAENPDEEGLEQCEDRADDLEDKHGVTIRIWQDAVKYTGGYSVEAEYQTRAINNCLEQLDAVMSEFPDNFLYKSVTTRVRICIVRSVSGQTDAVQYWYDGDAFILISAGADIRNAFIDAVSYVVDSHILGNSPLFDYWNELNPEGFVYGDESTYSQDYLEGDAVAFSSDDSMTSSTEDRCQVFWQAMQVDNADAFKSETMQKKLLLLCQAIRDAWRWERKTDVYPWEQYLTESIAYQK